MSAPTHLQDSSPPGTINTRPALAPPPPPLFTLHRGRPPSNQFPLFFSNSSSITIIAAFTSMTCMIFLQDTLWHVSKDWWTLFYTEDEPTGFVQDLCLATRRPQLVRHFPSPRKVETSHTTTIPAPGAGGSAWVSPPLAVGSSATHEPHCL